MIQAVIEAAREISREIDLDHHISIYDSHRVSADPYLTLCSLDHDHAMTPEHRTLKRCVALGRSPFMNEPLRERGVQRNVPLGRAPAAVV